MTLLLYVRMVPDVWYMAISHVYITHNVYLVYDNGVLVLYLIFIHHFYQYDTIEGPGGDCPLASLVQSAPKFKIY